VRENVLKNKEAGLEVYGNIRNLGIPVINLILDNNYDYSVHKY